MSAGLIQELERFRLPVGLEEATGYLLSLKSRVELLSLYRYYFPREWETSNASLVPEKNRRCSSRVEEFLELVDCRLFPIYSDYCIELIEEGVSPLPLPVVLQGLDWWNDDFYDLRVGWQFLLALSGQVEITQLEDLSPTLEEALEKTAGKAVSLKRLEKLCAKTGEPLAHLPLALLVLDKTTQNPILDSSEEGPGIEAWWDQENIDWLVEENRKAVEIWNKVSRFLDWLEQEPERNFKEVIKIWIKAT